MSSLTPPPPAYEPQRQTTPPPTYHCTVFKQGLVKWKKESESDKRQSWNTVLFYLHGTLLEVYTKEFKLIEKLSMWKGYCGMATDYHKDQVLRLYLSSTREHYLIKPMHGKLSELVSWYEHLQSSANISTDIDRRKMPRILTLSRGQHHQSKCITLTVGKTQAILPVLNRDYRLFK